jgi:sugar phosphate isomerase/epimerase
MKVYALAQTSLLPYHAGMRIATSTNLVSFRPDGSKTEMHHLLPLYKQGGFSVLDLNFCEMMNPASIWRTDRYMERVDLIRSLKESLSLTFNQSHAPYTRDRFALSAEAGKTEDALVQRAIHVSSLLGVDVVVIHPAPADENRLSQNVAYLSPFVEQAEKEGMHIALENLDGQREIQSSGELCALVDLFSSSTVGVCLDFGHAHMHGLDLPKEIRTYGKRLIATHVADNHGTADEHLLPFYGTIDWKACMKALRECGYRGDLTYECMKQNQYLPEALKPMAIRQAKEIGDFLLSL